MGKSNGHRQAGQDQPLEKTGSERDGKKVTKPSGEINEVLSAYDFMKEEELSEIGFDAANAKIHIKRKTDTITIPSIKHVKHEPKEELFSDATSINSPLSGVFYSSPKPGEPPFVVTGDSVIAGQTICIIEAMKVMNEIKADSNYKIIKILAVNGKAVSSGEALFLVKPE
ncbi:MAG: acetyl-CoA carboxylase, biotin carboxyl carrier protein [Elusimicrobia bacterium]|nr:acetyl-CoA carboxylase, biotin carboxyl carrier protein [Elusimicrobiota bacterium]